MQSQQKRVKWSRGETAEALEERTDTGVTQASLELMENCIPDIYGNISRRPALKLIPAPNFVGRYQWFEFDAYLQVFPFYITETDFILVGIHYDNYPEVIRIKDGVAVYHSTLNPYAYPKTKAIISDQGGTLTYGYKAVSYAQQNNYMLIADAYNVYKLQIYNFETSDNSFSVSCDIWQYSAGWYAPNGTQTKKVTSSEVTGMNFQANSIKNYIFQEPNGQTVVYSSIKTGIALTPMTNTWTGATTTFYVHNPGVYAYINTTSSGSSASFTMTNGTTYSNNQTVKNFLYAGENRYVKIAITNTQAYFYFSNMHGATYDVTSYFTNTIPQIEQQIPIGSIVQFPNNGGYMRVEGFDSDGTDQIMFGPLLTPVADDNATDTAVNVEYGFVSLQPSNWQSSGTYPHPLKLLFLDQRLWAGSWASTQTQNYSIAIGSQIAKYTDFKNDYNQDNESITLDILTNFKEKIVHLIDYNGLKIMTDSYEYAYDGKVIKQSGNGSLENCEPLIFDSICLYVDSTGNQI